MPDPSDSQPADVARKPKRHRSGVQAIGGVLAGFDAQVLRAGKPPAELVREAEPVRGLTGQDGSLLSIAFPDAAPSSAADPVGREAPGDAGAGADPATR
jgi:hypothetical protein